MLTVKLHISFLTLLPYLLGETGTIVFQNTAILTLKKNLVCTQDFS